VQDPVGAVKFLVQPKDAPVSIQFPAAGRLDVGFETCSVSPNSTQGWPGPAEGFGTQAGAALAGMEIRKIAKASTAAQCIFFTSMAPLLRSRSEEQPSRSEATYRGRLGFSATRHRTHPYG
jgi:hypothetical protein